MARDIIGEKINQKAGMAFWPLHKLTGKSEDRGIVFRSLRDPAYHMMCKRSPIMHLKQWYWRMRWQIQTGKRWWATN